MDQNWLPNDSIEAKLDRLNGKLYTSLTVLPMFRNMVVSQYESREEAIDACIGTGTFIGKYKGRFVVDGGVTNNKPIFKNEEQLNPQLVIDPFKARIPWKRLRAISYSMESAEDTFNRGQDDAIEFLRNSTIPKKGPIYLIPKPE